MSNCKLFNKHKAEIEAYCNSNALNYAIVESSYKSWGKSNINILHFEDTGSKEGLSDKEPLPVTLKIYIEDGGVRIEQTEHTHFLLKQSA